jgi:malonyl-CoA decarboxylase
VREAAGLMVNYLYDLNTIEANHESYANQGTVAASPAIHRRLAKPAPKTAREDRHV